jgi:purine-cytosine permease-like protein
MALLWITMVTCFPSVLIGFEWQKHGFSLSQVAICTLLSCVVLLIYTVPIAHLSAKTGKSYGMLNEQLFGKKAASCINVALILIFVSFYGLAALLLADAICSLFHWSFNNAMLAAIFSLLMALNNFFGFKGIANFARFVAAPVIIAWVFYTFCKAAPACPPEVLSATSSHSFVAALTTISSFIIGFAVWGNEADYWRYGKPRVHYSLIPLAVALSVGEVIFPITGWIVSHLTGITDFAAATAYMNEYSFGGIALFGAIVVFASYFAANDSNLFGSAAALEILVGIRHRQAVAVLAVLGTVMAVVLSVLGAAQAVESICSVNSVILPVATILILAEWAVCTANGRQAFSNAGSSKAAVIALVSGITLGVTTSGVIPQLASFHVGIPWLQAWLLAIAVFVPLRTAELRARLSSVILLPVDTKDRIARHGLATSATLSAVSAGVD